MRANARSAVVSVRTPGVWPTGIPARVAAGRSTLSTPTARLLMATRRGSVAMVSASKRSETMLRTASARASRLSSSSWTGGRSSSHNSTRAAWARRRNAGWAMGRVTKILGSRCAAVIGKGDKQPEPLIYATFVDQTTIQQVIAGAGGRTALSEIESKRLLEAAGITTALAEHARTPDEAVAAALRAGLPAVLKVLSPDVSHKSEVGGLMLQLRSEQEVRDPFPLTRRNRAEHEPQARFDGVAVQAMAAPGVELIIGVVRDPRFGPLVLAGLGGVFVEVMQDTAVRLAPVGGDEARAMLDPLRGRAISSG